MPTALTSNQKARNHSGRVARGPRTAAFLASRAVSGRPARGPSRGSAHGSAYGSAYVRTARVTCGLAVTVPRVAASAPGVEYR
ncbi:hypothetical protein GCM10023085_54170 [Actinomadura viridis]